VSAAPAGTTTTGDTVAVAYVHSQEVAHSWHLSLLELFAYDMANHGRVWRGGWHAMRCATGGLPEARNEAVVGFLKTDSDWLLWLDTDMGFRPDTVDRLLAAADPRDRPVVGALCFSQRQGVPDGYGGFVTAPAPTIFDWVDVDGTQGFAGRSRYPTSEVVRCAGTGSAAILIHRSVFEAIADEHGPNWYTQAAIPKDGRKQLLSEDLSFCLRAGTVNIPIHVHTGVRTTHYKSFWLGEHHYWDFAVAPPATEPVAVIVPVLRRPHNAEPFMRSLRASSGLATVYAVAQPDDEDTATAWAAAGARIVWGHDELVSYREGQTDGVAHTFAEKVNLAYRQTRGLTDEPWLFICGDDVAFHAGWLDHAQATAGDDFHVVGTNDLGNPRVIAGEHATHLLIRRSYIDERGASWDGPGVVCHEGYRHWYVDDEIVTAAKRRGVWAMSLSSKVEHLHPAWGKGDTDEVYELGQSHAAADRATFQKRCRTHARGDS
jgi:hypothetical protein